jgi:ArsR family transcriptional regulator, arsenate/arsenite/antimonite-responsive transcriptional repressor
MGSPWKAITDDNRREGLLLLKKKDLIPTEIAEHFSFTLPAVSSHLRILKDAGLITEKKECKNRFYSLSKINTLEMVQFFEHMYGYSLNSLKEYVENNENKISIGSRKW